MGRRARRRAGAGAGTAERAGGASAGGARPEGPAAAGSGARDDAPADRAARTAAKNAAARARLVPLREGERPRAVTVAAFVVLALALVNAGSYVVGVELTGGGRPPLLPMLLYTALLLVAAWGLWRARYWAVLGTQAVLVLTILQWSLLLIKAENVLGVVIAVAIIVGAATLFWFLIKAMARIQMPVRR